jgi:diaminopimelate decarboxylase
MFEPGRCIVTDAAVLLGKVVLVKEEPSALEGEKNRWIHVDCSTNDALNIISQGWRYHIAIANRMNQRPEYVADVCGPLCDAADVLASNTRVPKTNPGDIVAMFDMGSYAESKHCVRNCYPMPMTVLVSGDKIAVVRDRETVQDMLARDRIPYWLLAS